MRRKNKGDYTESDKAKEKLTEGREELHDALAYMDKIKVQMADWHGNTTEFFEEVTSEYSRKAEELSNAGELVPVSKAKALFNMLPSLIKREDPTKKRFGRMLNRLVNDAENIYGGLRTKLNEYQVNFNETDKLNETLIKDSKKYVVDIKTHDVDKKELDEALGTLEKRLGEMVSKGEKGEDYLNTKEEILKTKRVLEEVTRKRSSAINKYNNTLNILDALEGFRDENKVMISEGEKLHDTLKTNIDSLSPMFDQISSSADLVEFQNKALDAYDMLKKTFNPAMIAITAVSKGVSKVATERMGESFIEQDTINAVKAITHEHKKELDERREGEDELVKQILSGNSGTAGENTPDDTLVMNENEEGVYEEKTSEEEDKDGASGANKKEKTKE